MPAAGRYNQPFVIEAAEETTSSSGAVKLNWENATQIAERWGEILSQSSREVFIARQITPEIKAVIRMQGFLALKIKMRIRHKYDGRAWDIAAVRTTDGCAPVNASELLVDCTEGMKAGS